MSLLLGQGDRQAGGRTEVLALCHMDEPPLVNRALYGQTFQPGRIHEHRDVVASDQVADQRVELPVSIVAARRPVLGAPDPMPGVGGEGQQGVGE